MVDEVRYHALHRRARGLGHHDIVHRGDVVPKDFTDFVVIILDAGDRLYHLKHLRHSKKVDLDRKLYPHNGHKYLLELDRAYRIRWKPWSYVVKRHFEVTSTNKGVEKKKVVSRVSVVRTVREVVRSKKIGLLLYQMPCTHKCSTCKLQVKDPDCCKKIPNVVEPMHISRIHQPS